MTSASTIRIEFGDFQTPEQLAESVCARLARSSVIPKSVLEPSVGLGNLLLAAINQFPSVVEAYGLEINPQYAEVASSRAALTRLAENARIETADFFRYDIDHLVARLVEPVLVIGNPPWVTNAALATLGSANLPAKVNLKGLSGIEAITGRSNFDIAEWFLLRLATSLARKRATIALLCKTAVARQAVGHLWTTGKCQFGADLYRIDAKRFFGASVDACLLVLELNGERQLSPRCNVFLDLTASAPDSTFGFERGRLVSDVSSFERQAHLLSRSRVGWRSGIKHDCANVMELRKRADGYENGAGEPVEIESTIVYPLLKSTQIFRGATGATDRAVIVTQKRVGDETASIARLAPLTWSYLLKHAVRLDARKSSIYRGKPRFSVFGVGDYSFAPWKVCVSALHKELVFAVVGPIDGKPCMVDDTVCFLPAPTEEAASTILQMLESTPAQQFLRSLVFWDSKRPITIDILGALDLDRLAEDLGMSGPTQRGWFERRTDTDARQSDLFSAVTT